MKRKGLFMMIVAVAGLLMQSCVTTTTQMRSDVGLALGGGGAKAAAEIGVLEVIEECDLQIGYIAGSSMGAVVGVLYAVGYSPEEIKDMCMSEDWLRLFDKHAIGKLEGNRTFFGLVKADEFKERLYEVLEKKGCTTFEDIREKRNINFSCTATNIIDKMNIEEVDLSEGDLASAVLASMTYPASVFGYQPVEYEDMRLVDGGMLNNLPADVVRDMGAKTIIAVDLQLSMEKATPEWIKKVTELLHKKLRDVCWQFRIAEDLLDVGYILNYLALHPGAEKHNENRMAEDVVYIKPNLANFTIIDFNRFDEIYLQGKSRAREYVETFEELK